MATGPVDTLAQWETFPRDVKQHLRAVLDLLLSRPHKVSIRGSASHLRGAVHTETTRP